VFKEEKYELALDEYLKTLCAMDLGTVEGEVDEQKRKMTEVAMKIPVLNNMALCL